MSRLRPRWQKVLIVVELLLILGWVYLLFQLQPEVAAVDVPAAATDATTVRQLRQGIEGQLAIRRVILPAALTDSALPAPPAELPFEPTATAPAEIGIGNEAPMPATTAPFNQLFQPAGTPVSTPVAPTVVPTSASTTASTDRQERAPRLIAAPPCPYTVTTIINGNGKPIAVLVDQLTGSSYFVSPGETIGGWTVTAISESAVTLEAGSVKKSLRLE